MQGIKRFTGLGFTKDDVHKNVLTEYTFDLIKMLIKMLFRYNIFAYHNKIKDVYIFTVYRIVVFFQSQELNWIGFKLVNTSWKSGAGHFCKI